MPGYTPLFAEIVTSSIWNEDALTCKVWVTLMALADVDGNVFASIAGLAPVSRITLVECEKSIKILSSPDKHSRSQDEEGRRIVPIDGGWHLVNHKKYRDKAKSRADYLRQWRNKKKKSPHLLKEKQTQTHTHTQLDTQRNTVKHSETDETVSLKQERYTQQQCRESANLIEIPDNQADIYYSHYSAIGFLNGAHRPIVNLRNHMKNRWDSVNNKWDFDDKERKPEIERDSEGLTARQRYLKEQGDPDYLKG